MSGYYFATMALLVLAGFFLARSRATGISAKGAGSLHSLPNYHGLLAAAAVAVPMLIIYTVGAPLLGKLAESRALAVLSPDIAADPLKRATALREIYNIAAGQYSGTASESVVRAAETLSSTLTFGHWLIFGLGVAGALAAAMVSVGKISVSFRARNYFERFVLVVLFLSATVAVLTTIGIVFSVLYETIRFFFDPALRDKPTIPDFLFGTEWNPQSAMRADQGEIRTAFGFVPLLTGHVAHNLDRDFRCRSSRPLLRDLSLRVRDTAV